MNDVRLHVPYIFGNKQNSKTQETVETDTEEGTTEEARGRPRQTGERQS